VTVVPFLGINLVLVTCLTPPDFMTTYRLLLLLHVGKFTAVVTWTVASKMGETGTGGVSGLLGGVSSIFSIVLVMIVFGSPTVVGFPRAGRSEAGDEQLFRFSR
jgi:hypothetical protein